MDTKEEKTKILSVSLNQTNSHFIIGSSYGYHIFETKTQKLTLENEIKSGCVMAEMLFTTNFIALVTNQDLNSVLLYNTQEKCEIHQINLHNPIKNLKLQKNL